MLEAQLLIAPPQNKQNWFSNSVVLIVEHTLQKGAIGLCLNKPDSRPLEELLNIPSGIANDLNPVFMGGPVSPQAVTVLHSSEWSSKTTKNIGPNLNITSDRDMISRLLIGDRPLHFRILTGISGWVPGQLEGELRGQPPWTTEHSWLLAPADGDMIWKTHVEDLWTASLSLSARNMIDNYFS